MLKFSMIHFELLKSEVIKVAGIVSITPANCKMLSYIITKKTEQRISETTLKRIYGFAFSKFKPSLFTIDVLARFCNYTGWNDFCQRQEQTSHLPEEDINWETLQQNAAKISQFTLQTLKNRSGIPYPQTIRRNFIDEHFEDFLASGNSGTIIAAPAGYGKTIALCHWIDEHIKTGYSKDNADIYLFFSSSALMSVLLCGRDINYWVLGLLGYSSDKDIGVLFDAKQPKQGNFYLIIDGLDEHTIKSEQFQIILNQIIDLFSFHQQNSWFKLVLTMRTATWLNHRHEFENGSGVWHTGFQENDECINVPLFNVNEIMQLCRNINPSVQTFIAMDVAESFNHPLYLQFYYKQHRDDFSLNNVDHICIYDLISLFVLNKIYLGQHSSERILLIKELIDAMDLENGEYRVSKLKIKDVLKEYSQAYYELSSIGFLREANESNSYQYNTYIEFGNDNFLGYSIAKMLMYRHGDRFDTNIIRSINELFAHSPFKLSVLKWCVIQAVKTGQQDSFARLTEVSLNVKEKADMILFLGDLLDNESAEHKRNKLLLLYFKQDFSLQMFEYFFGLELINSHYKKTLNTLLKFELTNRKKILTYSALALLAVIHLNLKELLAILIKLRSFNSSDYQYFPVNPLKCLDTIYHYLKFGIIKKDALADLTKLSFNPPEDEYSLRTSASNDMLYLLGAYTLLIANNPRKSLRFYHVVNNIYKNRQHDVPISSYSFFARINLGDIYYKLGDTENLTDTYYKLSNDYKKSEDLLTPFMKALFLGLKIKMLISSGRFETIINEMKGFNSVIEESGSLFSKLYVLSILVKNEDSLNQYPNFKKQVAYEFNKLVRDNSLYMNELLQPHAI